MDTKRISKNSQVSGKVSDKVVDIRDRKHKVRVVKKIKVRDARKHKLPWWLEWLFGCWK